MNTTFNISRPKRHVTSARKKPRNHNLEEQARALYKSWFIDFEPFKDGKFVESDMGLIPEGWRVGILSELGDVVAGGTPSKTRPDYYTDHGIAWLTPKDLSIKCTKFTAKGEIDITDIGYKNSSAKLMPKGTVLFSSRAPIGYITIAKNDICTNQGFKSVVPTYAGTAYIYYWLSCNTENIEAQASGSTFKEASGALMKSFPALVPPKDILNSFEEELKPLIRKQELIEEESYNAEQIRDFLLPRLMSGELVFDDLTC
jgi:type I restriction enzyme S subunit